VLSIATGHCPMVSEPQALVEMLVMLGRRVGGATPLA
jgi:hypothetical protein